MSKICVSGAGGFVGSHIQDEFIKQGHEVLSIDNLSGGFKRNFNDKATIEIIDLCNKGAVEWAFTKFEPEIVFHCAANAREGASFFDPAKIVMANQVATINILEAAIKTKKLKHFVFFSSMAGYGELEPPFSEDMSPKPCDVYGVAKISMEETVKILAGCHRFKYSIIRPHNIFGIRQSIRDIYRNVIGIFMNRIMRKEPLYIYGDGQQRRQFSYIEDSLPSFLKVLENGVNETVNIGGTVDMTVEHLAYMVTEAMLGDECYPTKFIPNRYGEVKFAYCDPSKSIRLLGYNEKVGIEEGIRKMAKWAKELGPQPWIEEHLALENGHTPVTWRKT
ncbi:MAG: NAD-dependent epimerase/dehydratase family protein [Candidatus Izemoplasmatales bacterium]